MSIFNMLSTRWHSLFSITFTTFLIIVIIHISPVLANSGGSISIPNSIFAPQIIVADRSLTTKQNFPSVLDRLNLTSNQKEQIKRIHHQYRQQIIKKRSSLTVLQQQLSELMVGTEPAELIRAKNRQLVDLREEIGELRFESMLATREILTPQQRKRFKEIMELQLER